MTPKCAENVDDVALHDTTDLNQFISDMIQVSEEERMIEKYLSEHYGRPEWYFNYILALREGWGVSNVSCLIFSTYIY